jgi:2-polyprenyl-3-methyl-5-hydroxy-6-metoxy-1,4-benzoquinol methylase
MKIEIPGNYQYNALKSGNPIQRQWHKNKLNLVNYLDFLNHDDVVLDAGCGSGNILLEFAGKVKYIIGIDCNVGCINFLEQRTKNFKVNNVIARTLDLSAVGSLKLKFSKVVMTEVIEHLDEEYLEKTLRELDKVLALEGKILITTPNYSSFWSGMEVVIDIFKILPKLRGEQHIAKYHWEKLLEL